MQHVIRPHEWSTQLADALSGGEEGDEIVVTRPSMLAVATDAAKRWGLEDKYTFSVSDPTGPCKRCGSETFGFYCDSEELACGKHAQGCPQVWTGNEQMQSEEPCNCDSSNP